MSVAVRGAGMRFSYVGHVSTTEVAAAAAGMVRSGGPEGAGWD